MSYRLHITSTAERDFTQAVDYIEFVLKNPSAADLLLAEAEQQLTVVRFLYAKSNWLSILKLGFSLI